MANLKLAIDADGVLANFIKAFFMEAKTLFPEKNIDVNYQPTGWDDFNPLTKDDQRAVWKQIDKTENWWMRHPEPFVDNVKALARALFLAKSVDFYIVTSRAETKGHTVALQTAGWLGGLGVRGEYNYLGVIAVDKPKDKAVIYRAMDIAASIDDKAETVEACDQLEGHKAFLLDRSWNQHANVKRRVYDLDTYLQELIRLK